MIGLILVSSLLSLCSDAPLAQWRGLSPCPRVEPVPFGPLTLAPDTARAEQFIVAADRGAVLTQDSVQQSRRHNWDLGLTFISLTGSAIATGITASCTSTNECAELNPLLRKVIKESVAKAVILKSALNAGMHFLILRYMPEGRWRTISLIAVGAINWLDAGNDIREMRKIVKRR